VADGVEKPIGTVSGPEHLSISPHLDIRNVKLAAVDGLFLRLVRRNRG
jgi:hypothetical protein